MNDQLERNLWEWLSIEWFYASTIFSFDWANIYYLYLLIAIPFMFALRRLANWQLRQKMEVAFYSSQLEWQMVSLLRYVPHLFRFLFLCCLILALARPQKNLVQIEQTSEGIDILLVMDVSESMLIQDFKPNRLAVAKQVASDFVKGRIYDRIGLVVFSGEAYSLAPLTTDYAMLLEYIENEIQPNIIPQPGTSIGTALGIATNRMQESTAKSKVIILISDGDNTGGNLDPILAAKLSAYYGIRIYTIIVGTEGEVPVTDKEGNTKMTKNTINENTLKEIAQIGEGKFFRASNQQGLESIFNMIDSLEKSEIKETRFKTTQDYYHIYLTWAIVFVLVWLLLKSTFMSNILED